jgi:hypothetical protein
VGIPLCDFQFHFGIRHAEGQLTLNGRAACTLALRPGLALCALVSPIRAMAGSVVKSGLGQGSNCFVLFYFSSQDVGMWR